MDALHLPTQIYISPSEPSRTDTYDREDEEQVLLVGSYWSTLTWFPKLMLHATAPPWQIPLRRDLLSQRGGTLWHPCPDVWNLHMWALHGTWRF